MDAGDEAWAFPQFRVLGNLQFSPRLPDHEAYRLRIWPPEGLGDHEFKVENNVSTAPDASPMPSLSGNIETIPDAIRGAC
jgi:hypothetical protein